MTEEEIICPPGDAVHHQKIRNPERIGGWGEIRTHGDVAATPVFKTGALNRSATHPRRNFRYFACFKSATGVSCNSFSSGEAGPIAMSCRRHWHRNFAT